MKVFEPTGAERKQVEDMAGFGIPQDDIALVVRDGIAPKTLRKYFEVELRTGKVKANAQVAESLFKKATGEGTGSVAAAIFWCKTRMGWKEVDGNEFSGPGGGPAKVITFEMNIDRDPK